MNKCCMAKYCLYSHDEEHCEAEETEKENCPYLKSIGEIARLSAESVINEENDTVEDDEFNDYEDDYDPYENEMIKFIWGVKSWDDLTVADANLYTMNDIDIIYDKNEKMYMFGIETAYLFKSYEDECKYLQDCLKAFAKYMDDNGLNKNEPYKLWMNNSCTDTKAETIEDLYTNFKIFVDGFCNQNIDVNEGIVD